MSSVLSLRRRRPEDQEAAEGDLVADLPPIASGSHQSATHVAAKAATAGLTACLILGPVGAALGGLAFLQGSQLAPTQTAAAVDQSNERAIAEEFAQRVVLTWLTSTRDQSAALTALVPGVQGASLPERGFDVTDATVARIAQDGGLWSVTVAANVTDARSETVRRFYQVPVQVTGSAVTALTLPAPVSPPTAGVAPRTGYRTQLDPNSVVGVTVSQFLAAYLTGTGDVSRYLTPGVSLTVLAPPPYAEVQLEELLGDSDGDAVPVSGQRLRVLATAVGTVTAKQAATVTYALSLTARAGRWEITAIDPVPALAPPSTGSGAPPDTTSSSPGSDVPTQPDSPSSATTP